jgi:DNA-directed RNA polymerase specialized sigma24 family protein
MTPVLTRIWRGERAFERLYRRHVGDVYRYALVLLCDPNDAEQVTQAAFLSAYLAFDRGERPRNQRAWLLGLAHAACRRQARLEDAAEEAESERAEDGPSLPAEPLGGALSCHAAERAISREIDGRLERSKRKPLRRHLHECPDCAAFARSQRTRRSAWKVLASVPPPASLRCFMAPAA